jgi:hypothetical protein
MPDAPASPRGYPLPHPDNIAAEDALRLRTTLLAIDGDVTAGAAATDALAAAAPADRAAVEARQRRIETALLLGFDFT